METHYTYTKSPEISDSFIMDCIKELTEKLEITEWRVTSTTFDMSSSSFCAIIPLTLDGKKDDQDITLNIALKIAPNTTNAVRQLYHRETIAYATILKRYKTIQRDLMLKTRLVMPEFYYSRRTSARGAIAIENMYTKGFRTCPDALLDFKHTKVAVISLAKFHAFSYLLREQNNLDCKKFFNKLTSLFFSIPMREHLERAQASFTDTHYGDILQDLLNKYVYYLTASYGSVKARVICHGDLWKDNVLFKYKDDMPVDACLIDFQALRVRSPAYDILYFVMTSVKPDLRPYLETTILDIYFESFNKILNDGDTKPHQYLTREKMYADFKMCAPSCAIAANTVLWVSNGLHEEMDPGALHSYKSSMMAIIDDLMDFGYL